MNKSNLFSFSVGIITGVVATLFVIDELTEGELTNRIFKKKPEEKNSETYTIDDTLETDDLIKTQTDIIKNNAYVDYSTVSAHSSEEDKVAEDIAVISPDEYGENEEYDLIDLIYFADGILANDAYQIIDDKDDLIGHDALKTFGKFEDDAIFVVNHSRKCYYEIVKDENNYEDVIG